MRVMILQRLILRLVRLVPYSSPCTPNCLGVPIGGKMSRGRGSPGRFWCTLFQAGVTRQSHCTLALLHVSMLEPSFSHWLTIAALAVGPWLRTPENKSVDGTYFKKCCDLLAKNVAHICSGLKVWPVSNFAKQRATTSSNKQQGVQTDATCTSNNVASFCTLLKGIQIPGILPEYSTLKSNTWISESKTVLDSLTWFPNVRRQGQKHQFVHLWRENARKHSA